MIWPLRWRTPRAVINAGVRRQLRGDIAGARRAYQRAIDTDNHHSKPAGLWWMGSLLHREGQHDDARWYFQRAVDSRHEAWAPRAAIDIGDILVAQGKTSRARRYYLTAIAYDSPSNPGGAVWARRARARLDAMLDQTND
ncbi:tetratricopeptide repeat protein [Promicromonospora sp. NPDC023805]|uniref:tetratricopeptide repeat protein n=1 Tax=Promicromonospora sp. NPDC023805 TaxID=3154696 RepID=UPI0034085CF7